MVRTRAAVDAVLERCDVRYNIEAINHLLAAKIQRCQVACSMSPPSLLTNTLPRPSPLPPTLQPLSFASGPIVDLDELLSSSSMVNGRLPLSTRSPAVTSIPANHLAGPTQHSAEQPTIHSLSDCGHYGSQPRLGRSHSLLRNFSLRSRNSSMPSHQNQLPPPPFASRLADISGSACDSTSQSHSTTISDSSSDSNFSSIWKKWRVKSAGEPPHHVPTLRQERGRKRSLFVPFINVSRLVAFSSSPSSSHDSSSVFVVSVFFLFLSDSASHGSTVPSKLKLNLDMFLFLSRT